MRIQDERLLEAMRWPARHRMSVWAAELDHHRGHRTFRPQQWAFTREYGFTCECSGSEREWRINIGALREMLPEARDALQRIFRHHHSVGAKKAKRAQRRADHKAKALLHQHLSKEQRWELRATKAITITGQDGRSYRITEGTT